MTDAPQVPEENDAVAMAMADALGGAAKTDTVTTKAIGDLAVRLTQLQTKAKEYEAVQKTIAEEIRKLSEYELPNAMAEAGMKDFTLTDGSKISVERVYAASVKVENKPSAFAWMREHGHDALIKTEVKVPLGKGAYESAEEIISLLSAQFPDYNPELDESVHWQTLRAFVKEQVEAEERAALEGDAVDTPLPRELLGVYIIDKAKITPKKEKK